MFTTGPFALTAGVPLSVNDPAHYTPSNSSVQVQNNSGYTLSATIGGQVYTIGAFTATTIPTLQSSPLSVTPSSILSQYGGAITLIWLQSGEASPQPDGPLFAGNTNQGGLEDIQVSLSTGAQSGVQILAPPPSGYAWRVHQGTWLSASSQGDQLLLYVQTSPAGNRFWAALSPAGSMVGQSYLFNGKLAQAEITATVFGAITNSCLVTISFDLVQI